MEEQLDLTEMETAKLVKAIKETCKDENVEKLADRLESF